MAQGEGFKHITVTAPEEDDVVIIAGAVEAAATDGDSPQPELEPQPQPQAEPAPQPQPQPQPQKPARADGYRETTLDDLESTPMPFVQRIVIVAAVICIIGAIIYCVAFMG